MKFTFISLFTIALSAHVSADTCTGVLKSQEIKNFGGNASAIEVNIKVFIEEGMITIDSKDGSYSGSFTNNTLRIRKLGDNFDLKLVELNSESASNSQYYLDMNLKTYNNSLKVVSNAAGVLRCN